MTAASLHTIVRRGGPSGAMRRLGLALAGFTALVAQAAFAQATTRLEQIELQPQPGEQLEVRLVLDGPAPQPVAFTIDNPARLALDLPNTALALDSRRVDVKAGGVDTIVAAEASGRTRLVFNLDRMLPYQTRVAGNAVIVTLGASLAGASSPNVAPASSPSAVAAAAAAGQPAIEKVDFRRGTDGSGRIIIRTSDANVQSSLKQEGGRIVVDFPRATATKEQSQRYDVTDFATPVSSFDVAVLPSGVRLVVAAAGDFEQLAYQTDREFVLEVRPRAKASVAADPGKKEYKGERLTLNFQDIETRAVLQLLAETSGQNIVVSDTVQGNVTLRLQNVPWDQALDIVLRTKGLDKRQEGNVIYVAPAEELAAREKSLLESQKSLTELAPLRSEFLQVNYAKASDLASLIRTQGKTSLLSERGSVAVDDRTNTLLLQDTADRLADIRRLVQTLDIPVKQVLIEARVVIVNDEFSRDLGVRFGGAFVGNYGSSDGLMYVGNSALQNADGDAGPIISPGGNNGNGTSVVTPTDRYLVNLPVANPAGRLALTLLDSDYIVDLEIMAAQREGRAEVVSAPRVMTANGKEASIEQGVEIPYQESASSGATTTQFKKAVLSLKVTPQITPDGRIIMDLTINKDSVGRDVSSATGGNVPSIDTREIITQVLVNDGQTVVLGGILETEDRDTVNKVPYLGDIPGLGFMFRSKSKRENKNELLIFVTPKILREGAEIY